MFGAKIKPKPRVDDTNAEKSKSSTNTKARKTIFRALETNDTNKISTFTTTYEVWEALRIAYEWYDVFKEQQV